MCCALSETAVYCVQFVLAVCCEAAEQYERDTVISDSVLLAGWCDSVLYAVSTYEAAAGAGMSD